MAKRVSADRWLFTVTLCLVFVGLVMVFSASAVIAKERYGSGYTFLVRQLAWAVTGIIVMFVAMKLDYRRYKHPAVVFSVLGVTTLMLISVFFLDRTHHIGVAFFCCVCGSFVCVSSPFFPPPPPPPPLFVCCVGYFFSPPPKKIA